MLWPVHSCEYFFHEVSQNNHYLIFNSAMYFFRYAVYLVLLKKLVPDPDTLELPMFFGTISNVLHKKICPWASYDETKFYPYLILS